MTSRVRYHDISHDTCHPDTVVDEIHFIDYEYGAYNFRAFDIANHFCEFAGFELDYTKYPTKDRQYQYYRTYFSTFYNRK